MGTFSFVALYLFNVVGRYVTAVAEFFRFIESLEETHTKVKGMITPPHPSTTIMNSVLMTFILYLAICVDASSYKDLVAPGTIVPFSLEPILLDF